MEQNFGNLLANGLHTRINSDGAILPHWGAFLGIAVENGNNLTQLSRAGTYNGLDHHKPLTRHQRFAH